MDEGEDEWACSRCTLRNEACAASCVACGVARGCASDSDSVLSDAEEGSASDGDYDMACGLESPDEAAHTVAIHVAKRKWEETEAMRVKARDEAAARDGGAAVSFDEKKAAKAQIFTSQACFRMLSEELWKIKSARSSRLQGEAEGDDVHVWRVRLGDFDPRTPLGADLAQLAQRYPSCQADTLELRLRFKSDLYPFFPPSVDIVRPRLLGLARGALLAHPSLCLESWDPFTPCSALIERLRSFLEMHGRCDLGCAANDPRSHPEGAHSDPPARLDGLLAQLGALHGLMAEAYATMFAQHAAACPQAEHAANEIPRAQAPASGAPAAMEVEGGEEGDAEDEGEEDDEDEEGSPDSGCGSRKRKAASFWAKGTGYGYDGAEGAGSERWDPAKAHAAQVAQDEATQRIALAITQLLDGVGDRASPLPSSVAAECVQRSSLAPFLARELRGLSIMDMGARAPYYSALLRCIVAAGRTLAGRSFGAVTERLACIETQAHMFLRLSAPRAAAETAAEPAIVDADQSSTAATAAAARTKVVADAAAASAAAEAAASEEDFALSRLVIQAAATLRQGLAPPRQQPQQAPPVAAAPRRTRGAARSAAAAAPAVAPPPTAPAASDAGCSASETEAQSYASALGSLLLDTCGSLSGEHHYRREASAETGCAKQVRRVAKECAALAALLPLSPSSSVFVRAEDASTSLWRALITGPEGTPYAGGCFVFDMFFPGNYPAVPPRVNLCTTGGSKVRFNPNLYNCGKVCLSLLGTWHGGKGEGWDPGASSALQVLISIQSLIFVPQPVFNEPGYERSMGTAEGKEMNRSYNAPLRDATMRYAMLEQLRKPKPEFAEVIRRHFSVRRAAILAECASWVSEARGGEKEVLEGLLKQLTTEIDKLPTTFSN